MPHRFITIFVVLLFSSCRHADNKEKTDYIITEKDLIPEGLAFDPVTQTIYVSSTYKRKIISIDKDGKIDDFIKEAQDDIKSVVGMEVDNKRNSLWVVSSEANEVLPLKNPGSSQWRSSVFQFNLNDGKLIRAYPLNKDSVFLNDLTIGPDGTVYITESVGKAIYLIKPGTDSLELFIKPSPYQFINGICFSPVSGKLYASSQEGILSVELSTRNYKLILAPPAITTADIDGLAFHKNYFIAHQSSKIVRFYTSEKMESIIRVDTLDSGKEFDSSTTGEVSGSYYYYIVNSQIQSGVDYKVQKIKPLDSLENIIIRRKKI